MVGIVSSVRQGRSRNHAMLPNVFPNVQDRCRPLRCGPQNGGAAAAAHVVR